MTTAEAQAEALKAAKDEADAAQALARQELRRLGAGAGNPNSPAGMHRGAVNKSLNPPLFRTSLTAAEASLTLRSRSADSTGSSGGGGGGSGGGGRQRRGSAGSRGPRQPPRPGSQLSDLSVAWSESSSSSNVNGGVESTRVDPVLFRVVRRRRILPPILSAHPLLVLYPSSTDRSGSSSIALRVVALGCCAS